MTHNAANSDPRVIEGIKQAVNLDSIGQTELALDHLSELIKEFPTAASLHGYSAIFLSRSGRLSEAIEHGRRAILLSPKSEKASFVLFYALWEAGQHVDALSEVKRFLALRPCEEYSRMIKEWNLSLGYAESSS